MVSISDYIDKIPDPRANQGKKHELSAIIMLVLYGIIVGAKNWIEIQFICDAKADDLKNFMPLKNGIPSHDTFQRVFAKLDPTILNDILTLWAEKLVAGIKEKHITLDGKTLRSSYDTASNTSAVHTLNAFVSNTLTVLRQEIGYKKDSEITMIPLLLKAIDLKGSIVTIDAIGCQKKILKQIRESKADYIISLKANQPNLFNEVKAHFEAAEKDTTITKGYDVYQSLDAGHGRIENWSYFCLDAKYFPLEFGKGFTDIKTIIQATRVREINGKQSVEKSYYVSSLPCVAEKIGKTIRAHWAIENSLHHVLDVIYDEDKNRTRKNHAPANLSLIKKLGISLINHYNVKKLPHTRVHLLALMKPKEAEKIIFCR